jgi:hypothetical protein
MPEVMGHQMLLKFELHFFIHYQVPDLLAILAFPDLNTFCTAAQP